MRKRKKKFFKTKRSAQEYAEKRRRKGKKARVLLNGRVYYVIELGKRKRKKK